MLPATADRKALSRTGLRMVPALVAFFTIEATNFCWRFIRPRSAVGST